jgi:hypothetical protein
MNRWLLRAWCWLSTGDHHCCLGVGLQELINLEAFPTVDEYGDYDTHVKVANTSLTHSSFPHEPHSKLMGLVPKNEISYTDYDKLNDLEGISESVLAQINDDFTDPDRQFRPVIAYLKSRVAGNTHAQAWTAMEECFQEISQPYTYGE